MKLLATIAVTSLCMGASAMPLGLRMTAWGLEDEPTAGQPKTWQVAFDANGGFIDGREAVRYAEIEDGMSFVDVIGDLPTPERLGYDFKGWFTEKNGGTRITAATKVTANVTYYAHWTSAYKPGDPMPVSVVVGGKTQTVTVTVGQPWGAKLPAAPAAPSGKRFAGWFTGPGGTGTHVTSSTIVGAEPVTLQAYFVDEESYCLYESVYGAAPVAAASEYNGYLYDANSGGVKGTIQVKLGKPGKKDGKAAVKATVVLGAKKVTLKAKDKGKAVINPNGPTEIELVGGEACEIVLGAEGISGTYSKYFIDGARNFFASKDKGEQGAANAILEKWLGAVNVVWDGGNASVTIAKKGKAKATMQLADGTKATANAQLLVGEEWLCVPFVVTKKMNLAFTLWLSFNGSAAVVEGLSADAVIGKPGALKAGAKFGVDKSAAFWSQFAGVVLIDYLPNGTEVTQNVAKWTLPKAGKVVYKNGVVDESKLGDNPSALKLTYKAKDGSFKGSFKVYADNGGKLKATTVKVTGVLVNGVGYGAATIKDKGSVAVTIE